MNGSAQEPVEAAEAAAQMRDATGRLRDQGWMVAPMTQAPILAEQSEEAVLDAG